MMEAFFWYLAIFLTIAGVAILITSYSKYKEFFLAFNYLLVSILIIFGIFSVKSNLLYLFFDIIKFKDTSYKKALKLIKPLDFYTFYQLAEKKIKPSESFSILTVGVSSNYLRENPSGVQANNAKFQLVYYLTPRRYVDDAAKADYLIIINNSKKPIDLNIAGKKIQINEFLSPFVLVKL